MRAVNKIFISSIGIILIIVWLYNVAQINKKYSDAVLEEYSLNEYVDYQGIKFKVTSIDFLDQERELELFSNEIYKYGGCKCLLVYLEIKNDSDVSKKIDLTSLMLESGIWKNSILMHSFKVINEEQYRGKRVTLCPEIEANSNYSCILTYNIVKENFSNKQWKAITERDFSLVLSNYPIKKTVKLQ